MPVQPRRTFAPSVVLTVVGSLATASAAPADKPPPVMKNPPPPRKPPEKKPPVKKPPPAPTADRHWHIFQQGKECMADSSADACPPPPAGTKVVSSCNPPRPTAYACPKDVTLPVNIIQRAGATDCYVDYGNTSCPPNMACNPPPPRKLACP